jgi:hypothetical protein
MSKIKVEKIIYRHGKGHALKWRDIKLRDDDVYMQLGLMMIILIIKDIG